MLNEKIKEALRVLSDDQYQLAKELIGYCSEVDLYTENEREVFRTLSNIFSLSYADAVDSFVPEFVYADGRRTYAIEDLDQTTIDLILEVVDFSENLALRSKLAHILLKATKNNQYCNQAVPDYLALYRENRVSEDWVTPFIYLKLAFAVAKTVKKDQLYQNVLLEIDSWIKTEAQEGTDSDFISIILIERFIDFLPKESFYDYLNQVEKIYSFTEKIYLVERIFQVKLKLHQKLNSPPEIIKEVKIEFAKYLKDISSTFTETSYDGVSKKIHYAVNAVQLFREGGDSEAALALHKEIEVFQKMQSSLMNVATIDLKMEDFLSPLKIKFSGYTLEESILVLGEHPSFFYEDDLSKKVLEEQRKFAFCSLAETIQLDSQGRTVETIPPLPLSGNIDPSLLKKHCRFMATRNADINGIYLNEIRKTILENHDITLENLDFIVKDNVLIPEGRKEIIKSGLYYGLTDNLYVSMHILLPQIENIFRNLMNECGDVTTKVTGENVEKWKLLSAILNSEILNESLEPEIIFTFQTLMEGDGGANLRNLVAHGMLEQQHRDSSICFFLLVILIKFLFLYSPQCTEIWGNIPKIEME
ncbi:MAG: DUF4209 domain-containing protein [Eubacteriales bacterium]